MPPSFTYNHDTSFEETTAGFVIPFITFGTQHQVKVAEFNFTAGAAGTFQSITGVGFQPECLIIFGAVAFLNTLREAGLWHFGCATDPSEQWAMGARGPDNTSPAVRQAGFETDRIVLVPNGTIQAALDSFDADGFTLERLGNPGTNIPMVYVALAGGGSYFAGTDSVPASTGIQTVPVGFQADLALIGSSQLVAETVTDGTRHSLSVGAADGTRQHAVWGGADAGSVNTSSRQDDDQICIIGRTVTGTASLRCLANFDSFAASDFDIDWTTVDGSQYLFGYLAMENAAIDSFENVLSNGVVVPTPIVPNGLMGFHSTIATADLGTFVAATAVAASACDPSLSLERSCSFTDFDAPPFSVQQTSVYMSSFFGGTQPRLSGGVITTGPVATVHDVNVIAFDAGITFRPQIYRRVIQQP